MRHWPESFILDVKGKPFILLKIILFFLKTLHQNQKGQIIQQGDFITAVLVNLGGFSFMEPPLTVNGDPQPLMASASFLFVLKIKAALLQNFRARPTPSLTCLGNAWKKTCFLGRSSLMLTLLYDVMQRQRKWREAIRGPILNNITWRMFGCMRRT